jgi:hypothetical protein
LDWLIETSMAEGGRSLVDREVDSWREVWSLERVWPRCQADGNCLDLMVDVERDLSSVEWLIGQKNLACVVENRGSCVSRGGECTDLAARNIDCNLDSRNDRWF